MPEIVRTVRVLSLGALFALFGLFGPPSAAAQDQGLIRLDLIMGKSQVLDFQEPFTRVSVTNSAVADVFVITPTQVLVSGKAAGVTSLVVFYPRRTVFFDLVVQHDIALLSERLKQLAPRDEIRVHTTPEALILSGPVSSERTLAGAMEVASSFAPRGRVVNLMMVMDAKPPQVLLQVHVAEVLRAGLKELGFSIRALGSTFQGGAFAGAAPFFPPLGLLGAVMAPGNSTSVIGQNTPDVGFFGSNLFLSSGSRDYAGIVRALAEKNLLRTLAKPTLVTVSGKDAKFLSGGEFPYPVAQQANTISVEFKEFGVGLVFTPVVTDGEHINLKIRPEVSSLDFSQGLESAGFRIPVIRKNEVSTNIILKDGESFAIAGLINNEVRQTVSKIPLLGDIPILGALFRSTRFRNDETELLFLVTVNLVQPGPPGSGPDPVKLLELRESEKRDFTLIPGIPGVGEIVDHPFGKSNLPAK